MKIWKRDNFRCQYCGSIVYPTKNYTYLSNKATIDHIIPIAKGGTNKSYNLITACYECNNSLSGYGETFQFKKDLIQNWNYKNKVKVLNNNGFYYNHYKEEFWYYKGRLFKNNISISCIDIKYMNIKSIDKFIVSKLDILRRMDIKYASLELVHSF